MPNNFIKNLLKSLLITAVFGSALFLVSALILYKSAVSFDAYKYFSFIIILVLALIIALACSKNGNIWMGIVYQLPLILFVFLVTVISSAGFSLKPLVLCALIIIIGIAVPLISKRKPKTKKRNMNKIRRDYERLRKK